ncbi:MAG: hypothetical protein AB7S26_16110 [Sandaracinaceae bacterium]
MKRACFLAALLGGCTGFTPTCTDLASDLAYCDVRPTELACDELSADDKTGLETALIEDGCRAVWTPEGEVDPRMCTAFGWDCPAPLGDAPAALATQATLVFVGGIDGRDEFDWNPRILEEVGALAGTAPRRVRLPPWSPIATRAAALDRALEEIQGPVNLICYAVAGLDCRYLVSPGGLYETDPDRRAAIAARVRSVTTISSAHRGTEVATVALRALEGDRGDEVLDALLGRDGPRPSQEVVREALRELGTGYAAAFNERVVDAPEVYYQSFAAVSHVLGQPWFPSESSVRRYCGTGAVEPLVPFDVGVRDTMSELLFATVPFSGRTVGADGLSIQSPSDGQVSVDSARWGVFRGCLPADHYDVVGQFEDQGPDPITGFDAARFYQRVAADLATRGF